MVPHVNCSACSCHIVQPLNAPFQPQNPAAIFAHVHLVRAKSTRSPQRYLLENEAADIATHISAPPCRPSPDKSQRRRGALDIHNPGNARRLTHTQASRRTSWTAPPTTHHGVTVPKYCWSHLAFRCMLPQADVVRVLCLARGSPNLASSTVTRRCTPNGANCSSLRLLAHPVHRGTNLDPVKIILLSPRAYARANGAQPRRTAS
ncbi:hypothetical protein VTO73DRAFT_13849 [Trametes versicolor]